MRAPLLSLVLVLAAVATVSLVPAVCNGEEAGTAGEEHGGPIKRMTYSLAVQDGSEDTDAKKEEHGGSIDPMSLSLAVEDDESEEKRAKKTKEQNSDVQGRMTAETYGQGPIQEQAKPATAYKPNQYVASLDPEQTAKKAKSDELVGESAYAKKEKKAKKEISDYLDKLTSSKKEKKEKMEKMVMSDDSENKKKKKKKKTDDDDVDEDVTLKKKKHKKEKSVDDDSDSTSPKKAKKEKSINSDASSSAYLKKKEKESGDSDEATHHKKQKKHKKKKKKKHEEENSEEDAMPADVSTDGNYVPSTKDEEEPDSDATPMDVSTTTGQYVSSNNAVPYASPKQDASSQPMAAGSPDELPPAAKSTYTAPKQPVVSSQPMAAGSPDELPPTAKKPATFDPYATSKQQVFQPMAAGSPDELPPTAKKPATFDPFATSKQQVFQPMASGAPDELPPQAKSSVPNEPGQPKLTVGTISGMINIRKPIAQFLTPVIKSVCAKAEFPEDCEWSITTLPGAASGAATDSLGVLKLAMEAVREKVVVAMNAAADRMHAPGTDAKIKEALDSCTSSYGDIKSSLDTVNDALKSGDVDTATTNLDAVETDLTTCDQGFTELGAPSVMKDHDQELVRLASNLLAIGQELKKQ